MSVNPENLKPADVRDGARDDSKLKPGLVTSGYHSGIPSAADLRAGIVTPDGKVRPGACNASGLCPGILAPRGRLSAPTDALRQSLFIDRLPFGASVFDERSGLGTDRPPHPGRSFDFDRVDDHLDFGSDLNLGVQTTFAWWMFIPLNHTFYVGGSHWNTFFYYHNGASAYMRWGNSFDLGLRPSFGVWQHHAITRNGDEVRYYVDGIERQSGTASFTTDCRLRYLGWRGGAIRYLGAKLFDFRAYSSTLSADEIEHVYTFGTSGEDPGTAAAELWLKCDDTHPTLAFDSSGRGRHCQKLGITTGTGAGTFHHEGSDVPHSFLDRVGYSDSANGPVPRDESDPEFDSLGGSLQYSGEAPHNAAMIGSNCATFDGIAWLGAPHLTGGESVIRSGGTSIPTISAGRIDFSAGTCWDLELDDGTRFAFCEGGGATVFDVAAGNDGQLNDATTNPGSGVWAQNQNEFHRNILRGFQLYRDIATGLEFIRVPYREDGSRISPAIAGFSLLANCDAGAYHNLAETHIDRTAGIASAGAGALGVYEFGDPSDLQFFNRQLSSGDELLRVDRVLAYADELDGDDLASAQNYTADGSF